MKSEPVLARHFLPAMGRLSYGDPRTVVVGETLIHAGMTRICECGLHASRSLLDALSFNRGTVLCRVECSDVVDEQADKLVCREMKCLSMADITPQLREFALLCAERALPLYERLYPNDPRPRKCIEITRSFLNGKATREELQNASSAANAAVTDATPAVTDATYAAANAAANDAAYVTYAAAVRAYAAAVPAYAAAYAVVATARAYTTVYAVAEAAANAANAASSAARAGGKEERDWQEKTLRELINHVT